MKISVAMCTYNGEQYIEKQLISILTQSKRIDELIISDDHSKDQTLKICERVLSQYEVAYKIIRNDKPLRVLKNFQQAFSYCSGDIIFSCDQDDIWEFNKVEKIYDCFATNADINMVATNASLIDGNDKLMNLSLQDSIGKLLNDCHTIMKSLLNTYCITGATMAFRKEFQEKHFYVSQYWLHDGWLALIAAMNNSLIYLDDKLTAYRLHGNNECGVGDVDLLAFGTKKQLQNRKRKRVIKTALKSPFYFEDYAKERKEMFSEIRFQISTNHWEVMENNVIQLDECIDFWQKRTNIRNISFKGCLHMVRQMKRNNDYIKYCESEWFYLFDIYFWLIYKLIPRKSKR